MLVDSKKSLKASSEILSLISTSASPQFELVDSHVVDAFDAVAAAAFVVDAADDAAAVMGGAAVAVDDDV